MYKNHGTHDDDTYRISLTLLLPLNNTDMCKLTQHIHRVYFCCETFLLCLVKFIYIYIKTTVVYNTITILQVTCFSFGLSHHQTYSLSKNLHLHAKFMYFKICFYDIYCKGMRSQTHMQVHVLFVWLMKMNRSDDGIIENPKQ